MKQVSWRKQIVILGTAAALLLTVSPAYVQASTPSTEQIQAQHEQERDHWRFAGGHGRNNEERQARKLEFMKEAAQYFGISTEGKTVEQLQGELKAARNANPAKWEKFKSQKQAQRLSRLQDMAKQMGISTEGKTASQLHEEIREACKNRTIKQPDGKPSTSPNIQS